MRSGYLALETHPERPGLVRMFMSGENPHDAPAAGSEKLRLVMFFKDIDTAFMNAQSNMSHHLVDVNKNLYKRHLGTAMGDLESVELEHEIIWKDPHIAAADLEEMQDEIEHNKRLLVWRDHFVTLLKWGAILFLLLNLLSPLISEVLNRLRT